MRKFFTLLVLGVALVSASCKKDDKPVEVAGVKLDKTAITLEVGASQTLVATVEPSDAADKMVVWSSSDEKIAVVDKEGKVTSVAVGSAVVTAKAGAFSATCNVTVSPDSEVKGVAFTYIPAGVFQMGSPESEPDSYDEERPVHQVTLTKPFRMSKCEITNAQFATFLNEKKIGESGALGVAVWIHDCQNQDEEGSEWGVTWDGSKWIPYAGCDNYPVIYVTWWGAMEYAAWLGGTLPSEAQWEYACRAGASTPFSLGMAGGGNRLDGTVANIDGRQFYDMETGGAGFDANGAWLRRPTEVGSYLPNAWGLYDMHGNVREWCLDSWDGNANYPAGPVVDPVNTDGSIRDRVARDGTWFHAARLARAAARQYYAPVTYTRILGFRVILPVEK